MKRLCRTESKHKQAPDVHAVCCLSWLFACIACFLTTGVFDNLRAESALEVSRSDRPTTHPSGQMSVSDITSPSHGSKVEGKPLLERKGQWNDAGRLIAYNPRNNTVTFKAVGSDKEKTLILDRKAVDKKTVKKSIELQSVLCANGGFVKGNIILGSIKPVNRAEAGYKVCSQAEKGEAVPLPPPPPPVAPSPAPGGKPEPVSVLSGLFWNLWAENKDEPFVPQPPPLKTDVDYYTLALNLLPAEFKVSGVSSGKLGIKLQEIIDKARNLGMPKLTLNAFLLVDQNYFEVLDEERSKKIEIDLNRMGEANGKCPDGSKIPAELKKKKEQYECLFGRVTFNLKPKNRGNGTLAIILFHNGRPIEEVKGSLCIEQCTHGAKPVSLKGMDSMRVLTEKSPYPDLSLFLIELDEGRLSGILCDNATSLSDVDDGCLLGILWESPGPSSDDLKCDAWEPVGKIRQGSLATELEKILKEIGEAKKQEELEKEGRSLISQIFPKDNKAAIDTYRKFKDLVSRLIGQNRPLAPSIFVKVITSSGILSPFLPIGLAVLKTNDGKEIFLGKHFRIEMPLPLQSYEEHKTCISKRVTILPDETIGDTALAEARAAMGKDLFDKWHKPGSPYRPLGLGKFRTEFLGNEAEANTSTASFVLSHYSSKLGLYHDKDSKEKIEAHDITERFGAPSLWVLNGCESSDPDFAYTLNRFGIDTIIGTVSEVEGEVAGKLFYCMNKEEKDNVLISQFFHEVQTKCLWEEQGKYDKIGPKALKFVLLGNGSIRLCLPQQGQGLAKEPK